jgi:hypothetical protein
MVVFLPLNLPDRSRAVSVWPGRACENPKLDERPHAKHECNCSSRPRQFRAQIGSKGTDHEGENHGDQEKKEDPPAALVTVVQALNADSQKENLFVAATMRS